MYNKADQRLLVYIKELRTKKEKVLFVWSIRAQYLYVYDRPGLDYKREERAQNWKAQEEFDNIIALDIKKIE
jgi:hypothetical protein